MLSYLRQTASYGLCGTVLFSKVVVVANQKAARIDFEFCHSLAIYSGDHVISFEGFGDLLPFDVVASSVRLQ